MKYIKTYEVTLPLLTRNLPGNQDFKEGDIIICIDNRGVHDPIYKDYLEVGAKYVVLNRVSRHVRVKELDPDYNHQRQLTSYSVRRFLYPEDYKNYLIEKEAEKYNL